MPGGTDPSPGGNIPGKSKSGSDAPAAPPDDFITENQELMKALAGIGLKYVMVGLEAVSNRQLDSYAKGTSLNV